MRKDVKVGLVLSLVVVVVAGLYYVGRDKKADPVKLDDTPAAFEKAPGAKPPLADARDNRAKPGAIKSNPAGRPVVPQNNPRVTPKPPTPGTLTPPPETGSSGTLKPEPAKSDTSIAVGPKPGPTAGEPATREPPAGKEPVASASPAPDTFGNVFNFNKDGNEPKPADSPAVKISDAQPPASGHDARPHSGTDSKNDLSAPGAAATAPPPPPGSGKGPESGESTRTHKVELGDSYSLLAETYYGSQRYAKFLMDANPQYSDPTKLREGVVLKIPARPNDGLGTVTVKKTSAEPDASPSTDGGSTTSAARAASSKDSNDRLYVVQEDDTLYAIASRELGKGTRWTELLELNKDVLKGSPERLRVGQKLKLPSAEKPDTAKKP